VWKPKARLVPETHFSGGRSSRIRWARFDGVDTKHRHQRQAPGVVIKQRCPSSFTIGRRLAIVKPAVPSTTQNAARIAAIV
jgi:hypothetical protein